MGRLIDAEALKEAIKKELPEMSNWGEHFIPLLIDNAPTVEERPHGKWLSTKYYNWACSKCGKNPTIGMGYVQNHTELFNFCPNCGADMRGED